MSGIGNRLIPSLCYNDAPAAIQWLQQAFGFEARLVVPDESGGVFHAQLVSPDGNSMIMLFSARDVDHYQSIRPPQTLGGSNQGIYFVVKDVNAHYAEAVAAGAETLMPPTPQDYGGSCYTCADPEGHVWNFGDYDPWLGE
jgi:uncharacterized glyoxalase superfamily protein PhnB